MVKLADEEENKFFMLVTLGLFQLERSDSKLNEEDNIHAMTTLDVSQFERLDEGFDEERNILLMSVKLDARIKIG